MAVGAVVVDHDRLLMVQRARAPGEGRWSVPGGKVDPGETLAEAVARELREETGLEGVCGALLGWGEHLEGDHHYLIFDYEVRLVGPDEPTAGDDAAEVAWVERRQVTTLPLVAGLAELLIDTGIIEAAS